MDFSLYAIFECVSFSIPQALFIKVLKMFSWQKWLTFQEEKKFLWQLSFSNFSSVSQIKIWIMVIVHQRFFHWSNARREEGLILTLVLDVFWWYFHCYSFLTFRSSVEECNKQRRLSLKIAVSVTSGLGRTEINT